MNNHINNFLEHYIDLQVSPEYAVLLSGEWGSGKTFFINSFLENKKSEYEDKFTFIKISLFGIKSIDEVHMQIIFQLLGAEEGGKLESVLKLGSNVIDYFAKKINLGFNDIPIDQILKKLPNKSNKERIFIFDDLERIAIEIPEIFGYINILVEQLAHKCILLAHESPLINQDLYSTFKEKVIGKTFNVQQDFKSAFDTFVELANVSNKTISDNEQSIKNIFDTATYGNLRHIRQTILDFEYFYENIEKKFTEHQELMQEIIKLFFVFSIEIKSGKLHIDELLNFEKIYSYEYYKKMREVEESGKEFQKDNLHIITDKYSFIDRKNLLLSEKNWVKIFKTGILSKEEISENLNNCKYFMKTSPQEWIQLYHFSSLEDEEFNTILEKIVNKFEKNEYKQHEVLLHVISILLALSKYNLYDKSQTEIVDQAKQNIDKCINFWKFKHDLSLRDGALGYQYWDNNDTNFQDIKKYMIEKNLPTLIKSAEKKND